jgi:hypothetical protein
VRSSLVVSDLLVVPPPDTPIFRVSYGPAAFAPRGWDGVHEDGTFGNRFDDPGGRPDPTEQREIIPQGARFRVIYCATQRAAAFPETIARFRPDPHLYLALHQIKDNEPLDPSLQGGVVPVDWRIRRLLGITRLDSALRFVDIVAPESRAHLTAALAPILNALHITDVDLSAIMNKELRSFTQEIARYVYEQRDQSGQSLYAGIRYVSRHNPEWELWAIFHDRLRHAPQMSESIFPDDPGLVEACARLGLAPTKAF